jgi:hypothetical protein
MGDSGESNKIIEKNKYRVRRKCKVWTAWVDHHMAVAMF